MTDADDASNIRMSVSIPVDAHSCVRRECPHCLLEFKLDGTEELNHDLLAWGVSRVMRSHGLEAGDKLKEPLGKSHCPYCKHTAKVQDFMHLEHWHYLEALIFREYVEPMFNQMLGSVFGGAPRSRFVKITYESGPRSPRPLVGPEPTDMVRIRCLSCSALFKVSPGWRGTIRCTSCATDLQAI